MKVHFKINKQVRTIQVPQSAEEITLDQFIRLNDAYMSGDISKVLCAWYLLSPEELEAIPDSEYVKLTDAIKWFGAETVNIIANSPLPDTLQVNGREIFGYRFKKHRAIPQFRAEISLAQTLQFDDYASQTNPLYAALCAYIIPLTNPEADTLNKRIEIARSMPAVTAYPLASFFLKRQKKRLNRLRKLPSLSVRMPKWRALSIFLAGLVLLICCTVWLTGTF